MLKAPARTAAIVVVAAILAIAARARCSSVATPQVAQTPAPGELIPTEADWFHPDRAPGSDGSRPPLAKPAFGGRVIVRVAEMPATLNQAIDDSAVGRRILNELHANLLDFDLETMRYGPDLARAWFVEDAVELADQSADPKVLFGERREVDGGFVLTPVSPGNPLREPVELATAAVAKVRPATVITFVLRDDARWHDGEPFDAHDVRFSWSIYHNPHARVDSKRSQYEKARECAWIDDRTVRFVLDEPHFLALGTLGELPLLPAHLYDLRHPSHPRFDPDYHARKKAADRAWTPTELEQGEYLNENRHNRDFVGLGAYRLREWTRDYLEAERFDGYYAPEHAGYLDAIRWRLIEDDDTAFQALLNGELDFNDRLRGDHYFGAQIDSPLFRERFYKGFYYGSTYGYVAWNLTKPKFADVRVRRALAHCFDYDEFARAYYKGQAVLVTGVQSIFSPGYARDVAPLRYDLARAEKLLAQAGWYDRDGDGLIDKDGEPFEFELAYNTGSKTGEAIALKLQEELARVGIQAKLAVYEWATFDQRSRTRQFDAALRAWTQPPELDPEHVWHSRWAGADAQGGNFGGFADPRADALIERGQRELDPDRRHAIWRELHALIYEQQPYLFLFNPARKFAMNRAIRGFQALRVDPNYAIRRWYYAAGTPGTRDSLR